MSAVCRYGRRSGGHTFEQLSVQRDVEAGGQLGVDERGQRRVERPAVAKGRHQRHRRPVRRRGRYHGVPVQAAAAVRAQGDGCRVGQARRNRLLVVLRAQAAAARRPQRRQRELLVQDRNEDDQSAAQR